MGIKIVLHLIFVINDLPTVEFIAIMFKSSMMCKQIIFLVQDSEDSTSSSDEKNQRAQNQAVFTA